LDLELTVANRWQFDFYKRAHHIIYNKERYKKTNRKLKLANLSSQKPEKMANTIDDEWMNYVSSGGTNPAGAASSGSADVERADDNLEFSELYISTKTKVLFLNQPINIQQVFWDIPILEYWKQEQGVIKKQMKIVSNNREEQELLNERLGKITYYTETIIKQIDNPEARRIKFKDERKITIGMSRKDIINSRGKVKNAFYNCFAMILRFYYSGSFKEIHVKVFNTGKLEIPGILNMELLDIVKEMILSVLQPLIVSNVAFVANNDNDNVLINSNFNCGYFINRDKLHAILKSDKYGIESAYDPCSYPGVKCKYYFNTEIGIDSDKQNGRIQSDDRNMKMFELNYNKKYTEVSFMIFRTGSGLIVGNCSDAVLFHIFNFIKSVLIAEYNNISVNNERSEVKTKLFKIRKRSVVMTPEYYSHISTK